MLRETNPASYKQLAIGFARSGVLGYGGGPSVIPLIRYETVENYHWMDDDEFGDLLAMANALPGPIATKMAAYIGYRVKGTAGAAVAIISHIAPSTLAMITLLAIVNAMMHSPIVKGMVSAIGPVIGVMLGVMAYDFLKKTNIAFGKTRGVGYSVAALIALELFNIHPAIVIILFLVVALVKSSISQQVSRRMKDVDRE